MLHFIVNPNAYAADPATLSALEEKLKARGAEYDIFLSQEKGEIAGHVRALTEREGEHTVVAVGGDGTLNEVLCGIADPARVTLGLIPLGTGNDFAAAANIPVGLEALSLILDGEAKYTDYLECGDERRSINIAGLGIDVDILERMERRRERGKKASYFKCLIASLMKYRGIGMRVKVNGEEKEYKSLLAAVCNGRQFGGGIPICPPAVLDDGKLDLLVVDCPNRLKIPFHLVLLMKGKILTRKIAHHMLCEEVEILPEKGGSAQYDGELFPAEGLSVRVVSGKLKVFRGENAQSV